MPYSFFADTRKAWGIFLACAELRPVYRGWQARSKPPLYLAKKRRDRVGHPQRSRMAWSIWHTLAHYFLAAAVL